MKVECSNRNINEDVLITDGSALLYADNWPTNGNIENYINSFNSRDEIKGM